MYCGASLSPEKPIWGFIAGFGGVKGKLSVPDVSLSIQCLQASKAKGENQKYEPTGCPFLKKEKKRIRPFAPLANVVIVGSPFARPNKGTSFWSRRGCRRQPVLYETSASPTNNLACSILACRGGEGLILSC